MYKIDNLCFIMLYASYIHMGWQQTNSYCQYTKTGNIPATTLINTNNYEKYPFNNFNSNSLLDLPLLVTSNRQAHGHVEVLYTNFHN